MVMSMSVIVMIGVIGAHGARRLDATARRLDDSTRRLDDSTARASRRYI